MSLHDSAVRTHHHGRCGVVDAKIHSDDHLIFDVCFVEFYLFFKYLKEKRKPLLVLSVAVMSLGIVAYEPVFFVLVPILALQYWYACGERKWLKTALAFTLPTACMLLSCVYRGDVAQADAIW